MNNKNLLSIGEVAKSIGITRRIILNYEAKGLISPDKKDGASGNRYYTIDTFTKIRTIRLFQDLGLTLQEIYDYFDGSSDIKSILQRLQNMRNELDLAIEKLKERSKSQSYTISKIVIEPQTVFCRTSSSSLSISEKTDMLRDTASDAMKRHGVDITKRLYFTEQDIKSPDIFSFCAVVPPESYGEYIRHLPSLKAISLFHHGAYEEFPNARKALVSYAEKHGIKLTGIFRSIYLEGPPHHKEKSKFVTQIIAITE